MIIILSGRILKSENSQKTPKKKSNKKFATPKYQICYNIILT